MYHTIEEKTKWRTIIEELQSHTEELLSHTKIGCMTLKDCYITLKDINIDINVSMKNKN